MQSDLQNLKAVLKHNKTLLVNWYCGDRQRQVDFDKWGDGFRMPDHPHHRPLTMAHNHLLEILKEEDVGKGEIFLDVETGKILMTFSNFRVVEMQNSDDGSCPGLSNVELKIPDLHADDFEVDMFFLEDRSREEWITDFDCDIEFEDDSFDKLKRALQPVIDPYLNYKWYGFSELIENRYYLWGVSFNGNWRLENNTFTYSIGPSFAFVDEKIENKTVPLFA